VRRACRYLNLSRSSWHYRERGGDRKKKLVKRIVALSRKYPRYGYRRIRALLIREGWKVGRKLGQQVRRLEGLGVKGKKPRRRRSGTSTALPTKAGSVNKVWSWDFVHTRTENGVQLKMLTLIDEYTRQCLAIRPERSLRSGDNGPEFIAKEKQSWLEEMGIGTIYIDPGSPWQNGHVESFHNRLRDECLNQEEFLSVLEAQVVIEEWRLFYNRIHPHSKLCFQSPDQFAKGNPRPEPNIQSGPEMVT
jgi:transposase InsO family protein